MRTLTTLSSAMRRQQRITNAFVIGNKTRQVLNEFNPAMKVYLADENGILSRQTTLDVLLPDAFGPENLA